jgi:PAS domain S-box-containing protein
MSTLVTPADEGRLAQLELTSRLGAKIADARDLVGLFRALYEETERVMDATVFLFSLYDAASETVQVVRQVDRGVEHEGGSFPLGKGFTSEVIRTGQPRVVRRWATEGPPIRLLYGTEAGELVTPQSAVIVPVKSGDKVIGILSAQSYQPEAYEESDLLTLGVIASQAATAIKLLRATEHMALEYQRHALELEAVLANMSDALVTVDSRGAIVRLNRQARQLLGLDGASLVLGQPLDEQRLEHLPETARDVAAALIPVVDSVRAGRNVDETEIEFNWGPRRRVLSVSATVLRTPGAEPHGGVIVFRDVSSQHDLERLREDVFAMAWHDMHTPITVIRGHAELLLSRVASGLRDERAFLAAAQLIVKHSDHLADLLTALFDIRALQVGTLKLARWPTDLGLLAREMCEGLQATGKHKYTITADEAVVGQWDERRVRQVLTNMLSNATKYSPEGSTVAVTVHGDGMHATLTVKDDGIGLEPDEVAQLFKRGYRASGARNVRGGGLGLYFAHGLVAAHGGRMWADSPGHGRGSTFSFTLPLDPDAEAREVSTP